MEALPLDTCLVVPKAAEAKGVALVAEAMAEVMEAAGLATEAVGA